MKLKFFTLLLLCAIGLMSCRKDKVELNIKQYDQQQIQNYISSQGITGMQRDLVGGDTTGMYYQILAAGSGPALKYTDKVAFVFSLRTFDGKYVAVDTIYNHFYDYVGHIATDNLPLGLQTALINDLQYKGTRARILIPSHLAYGVDGSGSGSSTVTNNRIGGNQCLDYYVNIIGDQNAYDDIAIQSYLRDSSFTGYSKAAVDLKKYYQPNDPVLLANGNTSYYYYKVLTPGTVIHPITTNSTITTTYTGQLLNATIFDGAHNGTNSVAFDIASFGTPGNVEGLINYATVGTKISIIMPSALGYGYTSQSGIPTFSCLRFTWQVITVSP